MVVFIAVSLATNTNSYDDFADGTAKMVIDLPRFSGQPRYPEAASQPADD